MNWKETLAYIVLIFLIMGMHDLIEASYPGNGDIGYGLGFAVMYLFGRHIGQKYGPKA